MMTPTHFLRRCALAAILCTATSGMLHAGLVGYWSLNGDPDSDAGGWGPSSRKSGSNGENDVSYPLDVPTEIAGRVSRSLSFDANNDDRIVTGFEAGAADISGAPTLTISYWIKRSLDTPSSRALVYLGNAAGDPGEVISMERSSGSRLAAFYFNGNRVSTSSLAANNWTHVVLTYQTNHGTSRIYFDGIDVSSSSGEPANILNLPVDATFSLGDRVAADGPSADFQISELAVFDEVLSTTQISSLAAGTSPLAISSPTPVSWDADLNNGNWNDQQTSPTTVSNWSGDGFPGFGNEARFDDAGLANPIRDIDLQTDQVVSSLAFDSSTSGYVLDTFSNKHELTLATGGITVTDGDHTIYSNVVLGADAVWSVSSGDTLALRGGVTGDFGVTKMGSGTLAFSAIKNYKGTTHIAEGTLSIESRNLLPDGSPINVTGTLDLNNLEETIHSLSGTGTVNLNDCELLITNDCTFDGQLNVFGTGNSTIVVGSNTTFTHRNVGGGASNDIANLNPDTSTLAVHPGASNSTAVIEVPISTGQGTGSLVKTGFGQLFLLSNASGYRGATIIERGRMVITSVCDAVQGNTSSIGNGSFDNRLVIRGFYDVDPEDPVETTRQAATLEFTGTSALGSTDRLIQIGEGGAIIKVTQTSETLALSGIISDETGPGSLTKTGPGTLNLGAASTYSRGTTVEAGTLVVTNTAGSATGTGPVTVSSGATLAGNGTVGAGLTAEAGSTIAPGTSVGTLTTGDDLTLAGTYRCEIDGAAADQLVVGGTLDLTGATLDFDELTAPSTSVYILATATSITGTFAGTVDVPSGYVVTQSATQVKLVKDDPYHLWITDIFPGETDPAIIGPEASPGGSGLSNAICFAFALSPLDPAPVPLAVVTIDANTRAFEFAHRREAATYAPV
ncbi:MAG: LamG-like jellyroll fold domain-containing protein, partial [Haloferula sp.]